MNVKDYKGIFVFIEQRNSIIQKVSIELLGKGRELADELGVELTALFLGENIEDSSIDLIHYGADRVVFLDDEQLSIYTTEPYTQAMTAAIHDYKPEIVLIGATAVGRDLAPRVSARVETGLTADCTKLEIGENSNLWMTRPAFGGNIMATIICTEHRPQMSTVRPGVMKSLVKDTSRSGDIIRLDVQLEKNHLNVEVLEVIKEEKEKINIEDADVLVSGGRGVGSRVIIPSLKFWQMNLRVRFLLRALLSIQVGLIMTVRLVKLVRQFGLICILRSVFPELSSMLPAWKNLSSS